MSAFNLKKIQNSKSYYYFVRFISQKLIVVFALIFFYSSRSNFNLVNSGFLIIVLTYASSEILKSLVKRPRPKNPFLGKVEDTSFPSSHTAIAFSTAFAYMYYGDNFYYLILFFISAFFVGLGRVLSGAHYVSDVIAGAILAFIVASVSYYLNLGIFVG